ncbi:MAG: inositol monophosphatase family protein [Candidatus Microsaccharimonas sp.]
MIKTQDDTVQFASFAQLVARSNGDIMREHEELDASLLPDGQYLNEIVAQKINDNINNFIKEHFPTHRMYKKGDSLDAHVGFEWICDPLDGAFCYSQGYRISVTSVTLTLDGESLVSAVYDPWNDRMYSAIKNQGAWVNGKPIHVNKRPLEKYTLINREWWPAAAFDVDTVLHTTAEETGAYIVHQGSVIHSACLVASGVFGGSVFGGHVRGKNHEVAAAKLIVEEAGGKITDLNGENIGFIGDIKGFIISNDTLHNDLVKRLNHLTDGVE